jgi:hypothetical protein
MIIDKDEQILVTYIIDSNSYVTEKVILNPKYASKPKYAPKDIYLLNEAEFTEALRDTIAEKVRNGSYHSYNIAIINWWRYKENRNY